MTERLQGKTAIITGGASGIGAAMVQRFVAEGARVLSTDVQVDQGQKLADDAEFVTGSDLLVDGGMLAVHPGY